MKFQSIGLLGTLCFAVSLLQVSACSIEDEDCRDFGCPEGNSCEQNESDDFECIASTPAASAAADEIANMVDMVEEDLASTPEGGGDGQDASEEGSSEQTEDVADEDERAEDVITGQIGSACQTDLDCTAFDGEARCYDGFPNGYCYISCGPQTLIGDDCGPSAICSFSLGSICYARCESSADCRPGYVCFEDDQVCGVPNPDQ